MLRGAGAAAAAVVLLSGHAHGQQQIEWKQITNLQIGLNMPADVSADILGIRLGETLATARQKLEAIASEREGVDGEPKWEETQNGMSMQTQGGDWIEASYPGSIKVTRDMKGTEVNVGSWDSIWVEFSGPSSGDQVVIVQRLLNYSEHHRQVRISEIVNDLTAKFKSDPQVDGSGPTVRYWWQFNDGRPFAAQNGMRDPMMCWGHGQQWDAADVPKINKNGQCDVLLEVSFTHGVSNDHAKSIWFKLTDLERLKANASTDYDFFSGYVDSYVAGTGGTKPKL